MPDQKEVIVRVKRQETPNSTAHWEEFVLAWRPHMNAIICLRDIAENPVTRDGKQTTPITYDSNCLEEVCGSCAMVINGRVRMACSALVDQLEQPIRIEPMTKFPVVRDLAVDRSVMFENLKRMKAWVPIDGTYDLGEGPKLAPEVQEKAYPL
ncbi:MAG TPA: 2Fe-2S iron-sulfur cluster-binding protein, partial [Candidatus Acidoferrales bacterium]|nr:2Fe-2S iron-sulfur cluster-binding protein [Candidatus Acidoferrales bacterium]